MISVLFSRPNHDITLNYLFYYCNDLVAESIEEGYKTLNKENEEANKLIIESVINKNKPKFIIFNGHGSPDEICGYKNETIISSKNSQILKNSIVYSLSCSSALSLGPICIKNGTLAFIGYDVDFAIGKDPDSEASPRHDKIAKLFLEPSNILVSSLLNGGSVKQAIEKSKDKMKSNIDYLHTTNSFPEAIHYAPFLFNNYLGLIAHGDKEASIR